jgi:hypothetical protein
MIRLQNWECWGWYADCCFILATLALNVSFVVGAIAQLQQGTSLLVVKLWLAALLGEMTSGLVLSNAGVFIRGREWRSHRGKDKVRRSALDDTGDHVSDP